MKFKEEKNNGGNDLNGEIFSCKILKTD